MCAGMLRFFVLAVVAGCLGLSAVSPGRGPDWRAERVLGSERLELAAIDTVVAPVEPGARLEAALGDLVALWGQRINDDGRGTDRAEQIRVIDADGRAHLPKNAILLELHPLSLEPPGGFSIERERTRVFVRASDEEGLANGIYALCADVLGARWYWPGDLGFEWVGKAPDKFPERRWREVPAFAQRTLHPVNDAYGRRNRLNRRYSFNHNLARIFGPELFDAEPEIFAEVEGRRRRPRGSAARDPQADFTEERTVEIAVEAARRHFRENPESRSFSLSINDNVLFDDSSATEAVVTGGEPTFARRATEGGRRASLRSKSYGGRAEGGGLRADGGPPPTCAKASAGRLRARPDDGRAVPSSFKEGSSGEHGVSYFRGRPDYTPLVFGFMNEVAARVFGQGAEGGERRAEGMGQGAEGRARREPLRRPSRSALRASQLVEPKADKFLTALAYYWTEPAPDFQIHPRVMPVLTSDRAQWHDPAYRAEDKALIAEWAESGAERIATWDYYFGAPYPYPRQFNRWIVESIRYLNTQGADVFFSQLPSMWGHDGAKAWLAAELLWDPKRDAGALLEEYHTEFFGPAAEPMRAFYETAEAHRNAHAGEAEWIKFYKDEAGIELFAGPVLGELRARVEEAEAAVAGAPPRFGERVAVVSEALELTELYAVYHLARVRMLERVLDWRRPGLPGSRGRAGLPPGGDGETGRALPGAEARRSVFDQSAEVPGEPGPPLPELLNEARAVPSLDKEGSLPVGAEKKRFPSSGEEGSLGSLRSFIESRERFERRAWELVEEPYHRAFRHFLRIKQTDPLPLVLAELSADELAEVGDFLRDGDKAALEIARTIRATPEAVRGDLRNGALGHADEPWRTFNFLGPPVPDIPWWHFDFRPSEHFLVEAAEPGSGIRLSGADMVSFFSDVPVVGERDYLLEADLAWRVSPDNRSQLKLTWTDRNGKTLRVDLPLQLPNGESEGVRTIRLPVRAPAGAYDLRIHFTASRQYDGDYLEIRRVRWGLVVRRTKD